MESARGKNKRRKECLVVDKSSMDRKSRRLAISYSKAMMRDERKLRLVLRYFDLFDRGRYGRISVANDTIDSFMLVERHQNLKRQPLMIANTEEPQENVNLSVCHQNRVESSSVARDMTTREVLTIGTL
jgi:hypothetical protein